MALKPEKSRMSRNTLLSGDREYVHRPTTVNGASRKKSKLALDALRKSNKTNKVQVKQQKMNGADGSAAPKTEVQQIGAAIAEIPPEDITFARLAKLFPSIIVEQNILLIEELLALIKKDATLTHLIDTLAVQVKGEELTDIDIAKTVSTLTNTWSRVSQRKHQVINDLGTRAPIQPVGIYAPALEAHVGPDADLVPQEAESSWLN